MTEVRRYSGRTYGRSTDAAASRAFDDAAKPKPTNMKWGNASYSKARNGDGPDVKRPKLEQDEPSDPFSFEFDADRSPRKKNTRFVPNQSARPVVLQPAVRIASSSSSKVFGKTPKNEDEGQMEDIDLTVKKGNVRTYTKKASRKIKEEHDLSSLSNASDSSSVNIFRSSQEDIFADSPPETPHIIKDETDTQDTDDWEDGLYIEKDDGSSTADVKDESLFVPDEKDEIFSRPTSRRESQQMLNNEGEEVTVKFRSQYLNPEVYSKFTENTTPKDPVGRLSNSKVVHKDVLKHDSGTTLIVVCSPKIADQDIKQTNTQQKYFKDNLKDIAKSKKKTGEQIATRSRGKKKSEPPEKDPYEMEDDEPDPPTKVEPKPEESESPIVISSDTDNSQSQEMQAPRRSSRNQPEPEPKNVNIDSIVTKVKAAPPRKYHRIFRSRNVGFMEPQPEVPPESSQETDSTETADTTQSSAEAATPDIASVSKTEAEVVVSVPEESVATELGNVEQEKGPESMEVDDSQASTAEQSQESTEASQPESTGDSSEVESSQQSAVSDSQESEGNSSQEFLVPEQPKKPKRSIKTPPAERKIFRARGSQGNAQKKIFSSPKKSAAVYNVRSWQDDEEMPAQSASISGTQPTKDGPPKLKPVIKKANANKLNKEQPEMPRLTRAVHWQGYQGDDAYTSLHVNKEHKELYTVVKNVKEAHECQEFGETQEFDDDIAYLLAGIESVEPMSTRCLSCVGLAQKCTIPAFRMHLRAHGTVTKIFGCLQDAAGDPSLALCTSALMFMLSRDRLNMDLEGESLNLMLRLLGVDQQEDLATTLSPTATRALKRNKDRVLEVYKEFLKLSGSKTDTIDEECLSTGNLAMESLLSLTSRRAGEWFKEELRTLGALDHIVDTVCSCVEAIGEDVKVLTNSNVENLKKTDRCLRVLESVTYLNADNQNYLINYKDACLVSSLKRALVMCQTCLSIYPLYENLQTSKVDKESFGWVLYSCNLAVLRVLLNLTHDNDAGCAKIGELDSIMETVLLCILQTPQYVPTDLRFDLFVLSLGLLINLVEHSDLNCNQLLSMQSKPSYENKNQDIRQLAYDSLVEVFIHREEAAKQLEEADEPQTPEASPNKSGEWRESDSGMEWVIDSAKKNKTPSKKSNGKDIDEPGKDLDDEETFTKALHKAGKHMENSIVAAYVALLVGCLIQNNEQCAAVVKDKLPEKNFTGMIYMLKKFLGFMNLTSGSGSAGGKSIERVIDVLEKC